MLAILRLLEPGDAFRDTLGSLLGITEQVHSDSASMCDHLALGMTLLEQPNPDCSAKAIEQTRALQDSRLPAYTAIVGGAALESDAHRFTPNTVRTRWRGSRSTY